mmetsp:Transcript_196/g.676  ORF Transcript_196/g.676 Transcript_196/m.676 type:complete len:290 (-) Transcript_196:68-937(-)
MPQLEPSGGEGVVVDLGRAGRGCADDGGLADVGHPDQHRHRGVRLDARQPAQRLRRLDEQHQPLRLRLKDGLHLCEALLEGGRRLGGARGVRGDGNRLLACPHDRAPHLVVPLQHGAQRQPAPPDQRVEGEVCEGCLEGRQRAQMGAKRALLLLDRHREGGRERLQLAGRVLGRPLAHVALDGRGRSRRGRLASSLEEPAGPAKVGQVCEPRRPSRGRARRRSARAACSCGADGRMRSGRHSAGARPLSRLLGDAARRRRRAALTATGRAHNRREAVGERGCCGRPHGL